ncbi:hypothetical protein GGI23_002561, partial [Coemansia sp. RSA 2559]
FCGVVEAEDLPALEKLLDEDDTGDAPKWPEDTDADSESAAAHNTVYRALFPLLPALCKAIVLTIVNWSPTEKEFPSRQFLINVGPPQISDSTCLGIVKYPRLQAAGKGGDDTKGNSANDGSSSSGSGSSGSGSSGSGSSGNNSGSAKDSSRPTSPLLGSNVKRLERAASSSSSINELLSNDDAAHGKGSSGGAGPKQAGDPVPPVSAELGARLIAQYAQWRAIGGLMMRLMVGLQANHVLQADYAAQLLMNENLIPAMFWWMGTANLDYISRLPASVAAHTFMSEYVRCQQKYTEMAQMHEQASEQGKRDKEGGGEAADPAAVGRDVSDSEETGGSQSSDASAAGPSIESVQQAGQPIPDADRRVAENWGFGAHSWPWRPALDGLNLCMRSLRRLTSHNGLRKGLLYKNKALYFYSRLLRVKDSDIQRTAAELFRDIMPVVSKKQKQAILDTISLVYLHAPVSLGDTFWLADHSLDPQIEMHRHVELLRLLHFYHFEAFGLRLPRDPALFPSLVSQAIVDKSIDPLLQSPQKSKVHQQRKASSGGGGSTADKQSGAAVGEYSWLLWESDLEDTLNEVYSPPRSRLSSGADVEAVVLG